MSLAKVVLLNISFKIKLLLNSSAPLVFVSKMPFYAVAKGRTPGIFMSWPDCEAQVKGFPGARYKKFDTINGAQDFITTQGGQSSSAQPKKYNSQVKNTSVNNLKRTISTSSINQSKVKDKPKRKSKASLGYVEENDDSDTDDSDDLNTIVCKQLDDIEKRLKSFEKGVDNIIKKGTKKTILIEPPQSKKRKTSGGEEFEMDNDGFVQVYTDGACSANGKSGARAGLGVFWGNGHPLNVSEPVSGRATNNCGEIQAATRAIKIALQNGVKKLSINTDSKFVINSVTKWMPGWKRKGWKLASGEPVKNETDFKDLDSVQHKLQIKWNYVEAHRGVHGNEMADQLAKAGAAMYSK
ncbi:ribonuclease H1-like [Helicoverpa zea]|uniref:ribonuclease H1-like n=1 Tax=Helicoverpa zea TaxID=7113 RepID=UPI001F58908F|nr:ribonuclease H1-like [Helicoverpa zea]